MSWQGYGPLFVLCLLVVCLVIYRLQQTSVCTWCSCIGFCACILAVVYQIRDRDSQGRAGRWFRKGVPVWTGALCPPHHCHHTSCLPADWNTGQRSNILEIIYLCCLSKLLWWIQILFHVPTPHIAHTIFSLISYLLYYILVSAETVPKHELVPAFIIWKLNVLEFWTLCWTKQTTSGNCDNFFLVIFYKYFFNQSSNYKNSTNYSHIKKVIICNCTSSD